MQDNLNIPDCNVCGRPSKTGEHSDCAAPQAETTPAAVEASASPVKAGNRAQRRMLAAIARRMKSRPGTGYTKRSAAKAKTPRTNPKLRLIIEMKGNDEVADNVLSGKLDRYLK